MSTHNAPPDMPGGSPAAGIHLMAKPAGPQCNLNCEYCFYLEKKALFGPGEKYRMSDAVLSAFIDKYITLPAHPGRGIRLAGRRADPPGDRFFQTGHRTAEAVSRA